MLMEFGVKMDVENHSTAHSLLSLGYNRDKSYSIFLSIQYRKTKVYFLNQEEPYAYLKELSVQVSSYLYEISHHYDRILVMKLG